MDTVLWEILYIFIGRKYTNSTKKRKIWSVSLKGISSYACMDTLYTLLIVIVSLIVLAPLVRYLSRYLHSLRKTAAVEISP